MRIVLAVEDVFNNPVDDWFTISLFQFWVLFRCYVLQKLESFALFKFKLSGTLQSLVLL